MDNMCNKYLNWTFLTLKKKTNKLDLSDIKKNNGGLKLSLRNYMMQYFWVTFDY